MAVHPCYPMGAHIGQFLTTSVCAKSSQCSSHSRFSRGLYRLLGCNAIFTKRSSCHVFAGEDCVTIWLLVQYIIGLKNTYFVHLR